MLNCIFQRFATQNVHVQVLTTFHADFRQSEEAILRIIRERTSR